MKILRIIRRFLFNKVSVLNILYLEKVIGIHVGENCVISHKARFDKLNPSGIHIGNNVWILSMVSILTHDHSRSLLKPSINKSQNYIGNNSILGIRAMVMPGVKIGEHCMIAAGAVVTKDIPDGCMAAGNPAKIIRKNIRINNYGQIVSLGEKVAENS